MIYFDKGIILYIDVVSLEWSDGMKYDFDSINNRRNTNSLKWDVMNHELPMWVADMDFKTAPGIIRAMEKRVESGIYGYNVIPDEWKKAIINWWSRRHNFHIHKDWLIFCTGVVPAITCAVKRMTNVGDNVVIQTPVYDIFFHSVENQGRHVLENKLIYDGIEYQINFHDLEEKLSNPRTTMMILCNPHNPVGKIWSASELAKIGELCDKYGVVVLSDEIHCDITDPGESYTPFASVSRINENNSITCVSATKAFNIAGLQTAAVIIPSKKIFNIMERGLNSDEVAEPNTFATDVVIAAFNEGEEWLLELRKYIYDNKKFVMEYLSTNIPNVKLVSSKATYLLWLDCGRVISDTTELVEFIRQRTGLYVLSGSQYRGDSSQFIRMNIACPRSVVEEGMKLFKSGIEAYKDWLMKSYKI